MERCDQCGKQRPRGAMLRVQRRRGCVMVRLDLCLECRQGPVGLPDKQFRTASERGLQTRWGRNSVQAQ